MAKMQRNKGARVERLLLSMHQDYGIPCEKVSSMYKPGEDLYIADEFRGEVKARKEPLKTIQRWLSERDLLFVKPDRELPMVIMTWDTYVALMRR